MTTPPDDTRLRRRGQLFVALAALAWSTAGLLQRALSIDTTTQLAGRALFAFLALLCFVALLNRGRTVEVFRTMGRAGLAVAGCMAVASGSFIVALNHANVANVLFMQAVAPVLAALLAWIALRESVSRRTALAMGIALLGVALMVGGAGSGGVVGVGASFVMTLAFAATIVITRHRRDVSMAPAICLSQLLVFVAFAAVADAASVSGRDLGLLVLLGVGQMGLGLAFLTVGARLIPAAEAALITLLEVVVGPIWVWIGYGEAPGAATIVGGAVVIAAVVLQTLQRAPAPAGRRRRLTGQSSFSQGTPGKLNGFRADESPGDRSTWTSVQVARRIHPDRSEGGPLRHGPPSYRSSVHIVVMPYDPKWPARFAEERVLLEHTLEPWLEGGIHHVGSTAVPGLAAKPIIDMMAGIRDFEEARAAYEPLAGLGYVHEPHRPGIAHHFAKRAPDGRTTHGLHLTEPGSDLWRERLVFRDALRADPELAARYEALKLGLVREQVDDYVAAKRPFVADVLARFGLQPGRR